jgi:hypothetical protein
MRPSGPKPIMPLAPTAGSYTVRSTVNALRPCNQNGAYLFTPRRFLMNLLLIVRSPRAPARDPTPVVLLECARRRSGAVVGGIRADICSLHVSATDFGMIAFKAISCAHNRLGAGQNRLLNEECNPTGRRPIEVTCDVSDAGNPTPRPD